MKNNLYDELLDKHGTYITVKEMAAVLKLSPGSLRNRIYRGEFLLPTWVEGRNRIARTEKFVEYLLQREEGAEKELDTIQKMITV